MLWPVSTGGQVGACTHNGIPVREFSPDSGTEDSLLLRVAGLRIITGYVCSFLFSCQRQALGLVLGEFCLGGLGPSPTLLAGPSLPKHSAWSARSGGCRSQGCHGYPTRSDPVLEAPPSFQAPFPSSSIVDEFKCG